MLFLPFFCVTCKRADYEAYPEPIVNEVVTDGLQKKRFMSKDRNVRNHFFKPTIKTNEFEWSIWNNYLIS